MRWKMAAVLIVMYATAVEAQSAGIDPMTLVGGIWKGTAALLASTGPLDIELSIEKVVGTQVFGTILVKGRLPSTPENGNTKFEAALVGNRLTFATPQSKVDLTISDDTKEMTGTRFVTITATVNLRRR